MRKARKPRAIRDLKKDDFDFLIVCIAGWIPSHTVIRVISEFKDKPMILWGLAGKTGRENGRLATTAAQAGTTALRKPMEDMGYIFKNDGMKKLLKFPPFLVFMLIANEIKKYTMPENDED